MKTNIKFLALIIILFSLTSCYNVDSSEVGIQVYKFGADKGKPIVNPVSGVSFYNFITSDVYTYPTSVQHKSWTADVNEDSPIDEHIDVTAKDGGIFSLDVTLNYQIIKDSVGKVFIKYRPISLPDFCNTRLKAMVRQSLLDKAVTFKSDSLLQYRNNYETGVNKELKDKFEQEGFLLNSLVIIKVKAPTQYQEAINSKIKVQQETANAQAQYAKIEAQSKSRIVQAEADARVIELQQSKLTPMYLEYLRIEAWKAGGSKVPMYVGSNSPYLIMK